MLYFIKQALLLILICEPIMVAATYFLLSKVWLVWGPVAAFVPAVIIYLVYKNYELSKRLITYYQYYHQKDEIYYALASDIHEDGESLNGAFIISNRGMTFLYYEKGEEKELFFPYDETQYEFDKMLTINHKGSQYRINIIDKAKYQEAIEQL